MGRFFCSHGNSWGMGWKRREFLIVLRKLAAGNAKGGKYFRSPRPSQSRRQPPERRAMDDTNPKRRCSQAHGSPRYSRNSCLGRGDEGWGTPSTGWALARGIFLLRPGSIKSGPRAVSVGQLEPIHHACRVPVFEPEVLGGDGAGLRAAQPFGRWAYGLQ